MANPVQQRESYIFMGVPLIVPGTERLRETYGRLCDCLENGEMFHG
jgi:hypothetical protein